MRGYTKRLFLICLILCGCSAQTDSFIDQHDISKLAKVRLTYYQGDKSWESKIHLEKGNVVTRSGAKLPLTDFESESLSSFLTCVETGNGFRLGHEWGILTIKVYDGQIIPKVWHIENRNSCVASRVLRLGSNKIVGPVDYDAPYWREEDFNWNKDSILNRIILEPEEDDL